jgi:hypothetical protein
MPAKPKTEDEESKLAEEPKNESADDSGFKQGSPEWIAWRAEKQQEGKRRAKAEREAEEKRKMAEQNAAEQPIPDREMSAKPKAPEQKDERGKKEEVGDYAGLILGLILAAIFIALLYAMLRKKGGQKPAPDPAPESKPEPKPEPAPEPHPMLLPGGPAVRSFEDDQAGDEPFSSILTRR